VGNNRDLAAPLCHCLSPCLNPGWVSLILPSHNKIKRMSDVCDQYLTRAKRTDKNQYASLRSAISEVIQRQGRKVEQISFVTGARSVNKQGPQSQNLKFFKVPEASIQSIYSKLTMRVFDVYANILKCMYSTRFSGGSTRSEASPEAQWTTIVVTHTLLPH